MLAELAGAWADWTASPGERAAAVRMSDAAGEAGVLLGLSGCQVYDRLAEARGRLGDDGAVIAELDRLATARHREAS